MSKAVVPSSIVFEVLDGHNYVDWSEAIEAYLKARGLWDVVISDQQPPKKEKEFKAWEKKNAAALHAIKISCGTNTLPHIRGIRKANEAWWKLSGQFGKPTSYFQKHRNFLRLKVFESSIADEENLDPEFKDLDNAISKRNLSAAIELCKKSPHLLTKRLPNGLTPLAVAIGSHTNEKANLLYDLAPNDSFWIDDNVETTATVITKSFEAENLDIPLKLLKSYPEKFILAKDSYGNSPLCAAARAPHLFRRTYHHRFLPKYICKVLGPRLPLDSINFKISGMGFLSLLGNAISDSSTHSKEKIDIISEALFEAIKHENFNFILMLINFLKPIVNFTNDEGRNLYMLAIAHRSPKLFSLYFLNNRDEADSDPSRSIDKSDNNLLHMVGASALRIPFNRISRPPLMLKIEVMWFKEVEKLVPKMIRKSKNRDGKTPHELFNESHKDLIMEAGKWMKKSASSWAVVGPLIITVMFAAAFQVPGGSLQDKGYPVFLGEWLFKVYMVLVAISLFSATISVLKFLEANYEEEDFLEDIRCDNWHLVSVSCNNVGSLLYGSIPYTTRRFSNFLANCSHYYFSGRLYYIYETSSVG